MRNPLILLLTGIALLVGGIGLQTDATSDQQRFRLGMHQDASQMAQGLQAQFERARSIDLMLAQTRLTNDAGYFDRARVTTVYKYLEEVLYPGVISEACLIDDRGRELARVTRGSAAGTDELSQDEADNPFFRPTLALKRNEVYQSAPYLSEDTHTWVMATTTWIPSRQGRLIVHFEVRLDSLQNQVAGLANSQHAAIVDRRTGSILLSSDGVTPQLATGDADGVTISEAFPTSPWAQQVKGGATQEDFLVDGLPGSLHDIDLGPHNANRWAVVQWSTGDDIQRRAAAGWILGGLGAFLVVLGLVLARRQQRHLRRIAAHDPLTGIANRRGIEDSIDELLRTRGEDSVCVLVMDLDGFKLINDTHGHHRGDEVLREIATRLHDNTLEQDRVGRLGGDEFAVVLTSIKDPQDAQTVAHRLRDALIRPMLVDGVERFVGVSIGVALSPAHGTSTHELLRNADAAMYQVKRRHGGVQVYEPGNQLETTMLGTAAKLLSAINSEQISLAFQPLYNLQDGSICGAEALARWQHTVVDEAGEEQVIHESPGVFIPLAERTGLIRALTHFTLRKALDEAQLWRQAGRDLPVSVNLSAQLVGDTTLVPFVVDALSTRGLPGDALILEITETAAVAEQDTTWPVLQALRDLGVRIQLDDFGAGYASFGVLRQLPLDGVKIDRDLLADQLTTEPHLLAATARMAERFSLEITAEGIEDEAGLELSRRIGSHVGQGYHLARPMPADAFRDLLGATPPLPQPRPETPTHLAQ